LPLTLTPGNAQVANINFTPNQPGTHQALLTIKSNDPTVDSVFQIQLYGIGGNLASAPAFAPSNLNVSNVKTYRYSIGMNLPLNGPDAYGGYLVLRSEGVPINAVPQNGVNYQRGMSIGNAKVLFVGNPAPGAFAFIPNWILAGRTDEIAAFGYNGTGSYTHYAATSVNASTTTPATMEAPNEYSGIDPSVSTFPADLQALINPHSAIFYSDYIETLIQGFQARDTFLVSGPNIKDRVLDCPYSGAPILYQEPFQFGATGCSREHSWPHTWMPTHPADSPEKPEYNDQHNLFPTFQNANSVRCNYPLGEVVNPLVSTGVGVLGLDATGTRVFEPADYHKGRAARAIMYMAACYNSVSGNGWNFNAPMGENCNGTPLNAIQNQDVLKNWHFNYPSTAFDIARNDFLDSLQGNRNPFVDRPDYACYIDFITMAYIPNPSIPCFVTGLNESAALPSNLWPNPAKETVRLKVAGTEGFSYQICDLTGRVLRFGISPEVETQIQVQDLPAGSYLVVLEQNGNRATHRLMVP
jgi:endonuclease I